jgi:hypothetical protein
MRKKIITLTRGPSVARRADETLHLSARAIPAHDRPLVAQAPHRDRRWASARAPERLPLAAGAGEAGVVASSGWPALLWP